MTFCCMAALSGVLYRIILDDLKYQREKELCFAECIGHNEEWMGNIRRFNVNLWLCK